MGKIDPKDIYVAKDGTVYRVAEDGSLIKLKDGPGTGEPQKSQEPYKPKQPDKAPDSYWQPKPPYQEPARYYQETPPNPKMRHKGWFIFLIILIIVILVGAIVCDKIQESREEASHHLKMVDPYAQTQSNENIASKVTEEVVAEPVVEAAPAAENTPVGNDGRHEVRFYGALGDNAIHGCLIVYNTDVLCDADGGWYCYDSGGSGDRMTVFDESGGGNPRSFSEYYGNTYTGRWTLYWDETSANFANGTFTRASDGKQFPIRLYKLN